MNRSAPALRPSAGLQLAALGLLLCVIWVRKLPPPLYGVDAACYVRIAQRLSQAPLARWADVRWGSGEPFFEHPPVGFWLEALFFRASGVTPAAAVAYARCLATLVVALAWAVARRVGGAWAGMGTLLAFPMLAGFLYESQNPMLELPLTLGFGVGLWGLSWLEARPFKGAVLFGAGFTFALGVKGPPALALLVLLPGAGWRWRWSRARVATAGATALLMAVAAWAAFEGWRARWGLAPFAATYLRHQVIESALHGRSHPLLDPLFYVRVLGAWYPTLFATAVVGAVLAWRRAWSEPGRRLWELGMGWAAVVLVGFSLPTQKYNWYLHPAMLGAAWSLGALWAEWVKARPRPAWPQATSVAAVGVVVLAVSFVLPDRGGRDVAAIQQAAVPHFGPGEARRVADCGPTGPWRTTHLFALLWDAERMPCGAPAAYRFDGTRLLRASTP